MTSTQEYTQIYADRSRELTLLHDIVQLVTSTTDINQAMDAVLDLMGKQLHMMRGMITLVSPQTGEIRVESAYGLKPSERSRGRYTKGEGIIGRVVANGMAMYIPRVSEEPTFLNRTKSRDLQKEDVSFICVPIKLNNQVVGALSVDQLFSCKVNIDEEVQLLTVIAALLGHTAIEMQRRMDNESFVSNRPRGFVGNSESMQKVYTQIMQVGPSVTTVLLHGESGTGKELAASAIHAASPRASAPFITLNCAALPENLIESELFGHERGAFTGASAMRKGRFELAHGGTLFLDEIGELPLLMQAKLLRVLQERTFERLGSMETLRSDVRVITATNRDLEAMVMEGTFRRDLYYRLNVFPIDLPPLRERPDDILPLSHYFLQRYAERNGRENISLSLAVMDMIQAYDWPGNIRELENVMERAVLLLGFEPLVLPQHLPAALHTIHSERQGTRSPQKILDVPLQARLEELERACIMNALEVSRGRLGKAAEMLGLTERIMALRMKKYHVTYKEFRSGTE